MLIILFSVSTYRLCIDLVVCAFSLQAGKYPESRELTKVAMKLEEKELGNRPERMVELYGLMSEIFDEVNMVLNSLVPGKYGWNFEWVILYKKNFDWLRCQVNIVSGSAVVSSGMGHERDLFVALFQLWLSFAEIQVKWLCLSKSTARVKKNNQLWEEIHWVKKNVQHQLSQGGSFFSLEWSIRLYVH